MSASDDHIKEWINKTIYLSHEELKTAIEIAQEFREFAVSLTGNKN